MFAPLQNDSFLRACLRQATDHTPVWLMRQAGRYLPEYRETRGKAGSFMGLATNTQYATDVTLQPLDRYALDAAILFSDIHVVRHSAIGKSNSLADTCVVAQDRPARSTFNRASKGTGRAFACLVHQLDALIIVTFEKELKDCDCGNAPSLPAENCPVASGPYWCSTALMHSFPASISRQGIGGR